MSVSGYCNIPTEFFIFMSFILQKSFKISKGIWHAVASNLNSKSLILQCRCIFRSLLASINKLNMTLVCEWLTNARLSSVDDKIKHIILAQSVSELCRPEEACGATVRIKWLITNLGVDVTSPSVIYRVATTQFYEKKALFKRLLASVWEIVWFSPLY